MYVINMLSLVIDVRDRLDGMTRAVFTPKALIMDIVESILLEKNPIAPIELNVGLYDRRRPHELASDSNVLTEIYASAYPVLASLLEDYRDPHEDAFLCAVACKGGNIIIIPQEGITTWEYHHGTDYVTRKRY